MKDYFDNSGIINLLSKYKLHLIIITLIAIAASVIFSGERFIKPKYKAVAILYPSNIIPYSDETSTEQMLQLLQANDIREKIIAKYNYQDKFNIKLNTPAAKAKLYAIYDENVVIKKTEYESVKIEVWDTNPDTAAAMAKDIIVFMSDKAREVRQNTGRELQKMYEESMQYKLALIDSMEKMAKEIRVKYGILDYEAQSKEVSKQYLQAIAKGSKTGITEMDRVIRNLEEKGGEYMALQNNIQGERKDYYKIKSKRDKELSNATKTLTYANVITKPEPPDSKSYPVRWIIVTVTTLSTLLLAIIILSIIDNRNRRVTSIE